MVYFVVKKTPLFHYGPWIFFWFLVCFGCGFEWNTTILMSFVSKNGKKVKWKEGTYSLRIIAKPLKLNSEWQYWKKKKWLGTSSWPRSTINNFSEWRRENTACSFLASRGSDLINCLRYCCCEVVLWFHIIIRRPGWSLMVERGIRIAALLVDFAKRRDSHPGQLRWERSLKIWVK